MGVRRQPSPCKTLVKSNMSSTSTDSQKALDGMKALMMDNTCKNLFQIFKPSLFCVMTGRKLLTIARIESSVSVKKEYLQNAFPHRLFT